MSERTRIKILAIVGPTATGKSDLAIRMARKLRGEVISADSRQVYKGLDIGTGKVTKKEMKGVKHHLIDVANPRTSVSTSGRSAFTSASSRFSVDRFRELGEKAIRDITSRGKLPIVCGGTGLYIDALLDGASVPAVPPNEQLRSRLSKKTAAELFIILNKKDPNRAKMLKDNGSDWKNPQRLTRSIEIAEAIGKVPPRVFQPKEGVLMIGLASSMDEMRARIRKRLEKRMKAGMLGEAKRLHWAGLSWKRMEELGLEYRYMARHIQGKISRDEMMEKLAIEIGRYARRQMTWFKRNKNIKWFRPEMRHKIDKFILEEYNSR